MILNNPSELIWYNYSMIRSEIESIIENVCRELYPEADARVVLSRTDEQFGDYASNIAMQLAKQIGRPPRDVAQEIIDALHSDLLASAELAGPGFINITLTDSSLVGLAAPEVPKLLTNEK
jgi:arginyl-tRNA synthetase